MKLHEALLLLLLPLSACWVDNFIQSCPEFFIKLNGVVSPPTMFNGDQYKQICQTRNDVCEYATFYDTTNKIPVYSAYEFKGLKDCTRKSDWLIEPQLEDPELGRNMDKESPGRAAVNQSRNDDYQNQTGPIQYHKGHLAPVYHASSQSCADSTFTLTNAAPQVPSFNRRWFRYAEKPMADFLTTQCINKHLKAYVVTGVVANNTGNKLKNRVRIPSHFWTAYCCLDNNNKPIHSNAYFGQNEEKAEPKQFSRQDLEANLTNKYGGPFAVFGGGC